MHAADRLDHVTNKMARVGWAWVLICVVSSMSAVGLCNFAVHLEKYVHIMRQIFPIQEDPEVHMNVVSRNILQLLHSLTQLNHHHKT